jgi:hypothetical protein
METKFRKGIGGKIIAEQADREGHLPLEAESVYPSATYVYVRQHRDARRHLPQFHNADLASYCYSTVLLVSTKFSSSGFSHICLHRSKCVDISLGAWTGLDKCKHM